MDELLTEVQVGALLDVAVTTLQQWRHRGKGPPFVKEGVWVRYRRGDVDGWLSARRALTRDGMRVHDAAWEARSRRSKAAMAKLTPEQRTERARRAALARWAARRA